MPINHNSLQTVTKSPPNYKQMFSMRISADHNVVINYLNMYVKNEKLLDFYKELLIIYKSEKEPA